jgi:large subunit ribosomal protein L25
MKTVVVKGQKRETIGKKESKKLRSQEIIPAVLYGGDEVIHFAVPFSELRKVVYTPSNFLIELDIDGKTYKAMMQDIQWHPVDEAVLHIDFLKIHDDKLVKIDIPVKILGLAKGITAGGKLKINLRRLKVKALASDLPDSIDIDVTELGISESIKVGELALDNLDLLDNKSNVVVGVVVTRAAVAEEEEEEEGEEGEGEEGEGEEGAASEE